jgi:hypothetical protein
VIILCERCFARIGDDEPVVRLIGRADGGIRWGYRYQHPSGVAQCLPPRPAAHVRPDTDDLEAARGIAVHRTEHCRPED